MKKIFLSAIICLIFTNARSQSEGFRYGGLFGLGRADFKKNSGITSTGELLATAGLAVNKQFTNNFGLNLNVLFVKKGANVSGTTLESGGFFTSDNRYPYIDTYRLFYGELPLLAKVSVGINNFYIKAFAGPSLNFHLMAYQKRTYDDSNYNSRYGYNQKMGGSEVMEFAAVYGAGLEVENRSNDIFFLDFRASNALTSFNKIERTDNKNVKIPAYNNYFSVSLGYMYKYD